MIATLVAALMLPPVTTLDDPVVLRKLCVDVLTFEPRDTWREAVKRYRVHHSTAKDDVLVEELHKRWHDEAWMKKARAKFGMDKEPGATLYREVLLSEVGAVPEKVWQAWAFASPYGAGIDFLEETVLPYWHARSAERSLYLRELMGPQPVPDVPVIVR